MSEEDEEIFVVALDDEGNEIVEDEDPLGHLKVAEDGSLDLTYTEQLYRRMEYDSGDRFAIYKLMAYFREDVVRGGRIFCCLLYTSPSPRDLSTSRMPSSA